MDLTFRGAEPAPTADNVVRMPAATTAADRGVARGWRIAMAVTLVVGVAARFVAWSDLWLDEALTVNIARLPLSEMGTALRQDGSPPLFYALLHFWMDVFGTSTFAVRALPGLFGVAALPLAWKAAGRVGGRRVATAALVLMAAGPFAVRYATEVRMYSLVMVLVLAGFLAALALLEGGRGRPAAVLAGATGALLLTHYWSFYLLAVAFAAFVLIARRSPEPAAAGARRGLAALAAGSVAFVPWLPAFLYQMGNTGTPWGNPGDLRSLFDTVTHFAGGYWDPGIILGLGYFGLIVLALFGRAVDRRRILLELRPHAPAAGPAAVAFGTLALAIVAGQLTRSAFAVRYAAVLYPLFIVVIALGAAVLTDHRLHHGLLAVMVVLGFWAIVPNVLGNRTSASRVASALEASARPGDVVAYCPDQLGPSVTRELQAEGLVQLTFPRAAAPDRVNWVDYAEVNRAASTAEFARMLLERAGPANDIWVVWAPGYRTFGTKCQNLIDRLDDVRPRDERVVKVSTKYFERPGLVRFRADAAG